MVLKSYQRRFLPWIYWNFTKHANKSQPVFEPSILLTTIYDHLEKFTDCPRTNRTYLLDNYGFSVGIQDSVLHRRGVFVELGIASVGSIVACYPGTVYHPGDPILLQSISNSFIFQCSDGVFIDGKHNGVSGMFYKSCSEKHRLGPYMTCDTSWLKLSNLRNPLACGQIVNNGGSKNANVCYCEIDIDLRCVPLRQRSFIPNVLNSEPSSFLRLVVLVATKDINMGEEILSSYFSIV